MKGKFLFFILLPLFCSSQTLVADFSATPLTGCPPMQVKFTDLTTGSPTSWKWDFGNGTISTSPNPTTLFFNTGSYTIKLIVSNASGTDSMVKTQYIQLKPPPISNFTATPLLGCAPLPVQFSDNSSASSGSIVSWQWDFGDGTSSTLQNPLHVYKSSGNYTITEWVTNSFGCQSIVSKSSYVKVLETPDLDFTFSVSQGCTAPAFVTFKNNSTGGSSANFLWDFGDGTTSTVFNPTHNYANLGSYTIKLIATNPNGCSDTLIKPDAIKVQFAKADFTVPATICLGSPVTLLNTSLPGSVSAHWEFGDGTSSNLINPVKSFTTTGNYQVKLVNNFGSCLDSITKTVSVNTKSVAAFTATNNVDCKTPLVVQFSNTSTGVTNYEWDFGDSTTSTAANPVHTYLKPGLYTVTLKAFNGSGCVDIVIKKDFVKIQPPAVNISNIPANACLPLSFTPNYTLAASPGTTTFWDFGDGATSTLAIPTHVYTTPGSYTLKLKIATPNGCIGDYIFDSAINVGNKPVANFTGTPTQICAGKAINFTDLSSSTTTKWLWRFGDGQTSRQSNPAHIYYDTGYFSVSLIATNFGCSDTMLRSQFVYIKPPAAGFDTAFLCSDRLTRKFIDKSVAPLTWNWQFGDGDSSTVQNPSHSYAAPGLYNVQLTVTNGECSHSTIQPVRVLFKQTNLLADTSAICRGGRVVLDVINADTSNIINYYWYFYGTKVGAPTRTLTEPVAWNYDSIGSYPAAVVIEDKLGCIDTLNLPKPIQVYGVFANFGADPPGICVSKTVNFIDSSRTDNTHKISKWSWNFGDGSSQTFTAPPFPHTYTTPGIFTVGLTAENSFGCKDSIQKIDAVIVTKPNAVFEPEDTLSCPGAPLKFINQSTGLGLTYEWKFGDGDTSTLANPIHAYTKAGKYTVSLKITTVGGCTDSLTKVNIVTVDRPRAKFAVSDTFICQPVQLLFFDSSSFVRKWNWTFGNGNNSSLQNPVNVFSVTQRYVVKLVVTSAGGCQDSAFQAINVDLLTATLEYTPLTGCAPVPISFTAHSSRKVNYTWNFGDGNTVSSTDSTAANTYILPGKFVPQIFLRDVRGCVVPINGKDTILIEKIIPKFGVSNRNICDSAQVQFTDSSLHTGAVNYKWDFGDGTFSTLQNPTHWYTQTGSYTVKLVVTSAKLGCGDSVIYPNYITVVQTVAPTITITASDTVICKNKPIVFIAKIVNGGSKPIYNWKVNGVNVGTSSDTLILTTLSNMDVVSCVLASSLPCVTSRAVLSNGIKITVIDYLTPSVTITANITDVCVNGVATFTAVAINGGTRPTYQWRLNGKNVGSDTIIYFNNRLRDGDVITCLLTSNFPCVTMPTVSSNSIRMTIYQFPIVNAGPDIYVLPGRTVELDPQVTATNPSFKWTPSTYLSNDAIQRPNSNPLADINYKLTVTGAGGCATTDDVFVRIVKLKIPNVFSPNRDGINDTWVIDNLYLFPDADVQVYTRYGQQIFHSTGYEKPWDGTFKGAPVPVAVYYYIIDIKSQGVKPVGGSITVLK